MSLARLPCGCPRSGAKSRLAGAYAVRRFTYLPHCTLGTHAHAEDRIVLTVRGALESNYGARRLPLDEFRAVYRPRETDHRDVYAGETVCIGILLPGGRRPRVACAFNDEDLPAMSRRLCAELDAVDSASEIAVESLCALIEARLQPERACARPATRWLRRVRDRIEDEYARPPTLETIASAAGRNASYVATAFRAAYGKTIGDYVRDVRVWRTRRLVEDASIPLAEVALRGGFADQSHFSRIFRRRFAMTPGQYRRRARS